VLQAIISESMRRIKNMFRREKVLWVREGHEMISLIWQCHRVALSKSRQSHF